MTVKHKPPVLNEDYTNELPLCSLFLRPSAWTRRKVEKTLCVITPTLLCPFQSAADMIRWQLSGLPSFCTVYFTSCATKNCLQTNVAAKIMIDTVSNSHAFRLSRIHELAGKIWKQEAIKHHAFLP